MAQFMKVRCGGCKNEQVVSGSASSIVKCVICGEVLVKPTGGKSKVVAAAVETY